MKKRLLLGTTNPAKLNRLHDFLAPLAIDTLSPDDLNINLDIKENGYSPEENARIKAKAYFAAAGLPTLAVDAGLRITKFPPEKQPGVFVRRVGNTNQRVTDDELLNYYVKELQKVGGESAGYWLVALALMVSKDHLYTHTFDLKTCFTARKSAVVRSGEPLSSLTINSKTGKYISETPSEERPDSRWIREFVASHLDQLS